MDVDVTKGLSLLFCFLSFKSEFLIFIKGEIVIKLRKNFQLKDAVS